MGIGRYLLVFLSLLIGSSSLAQGNCEYIKPETVIGKADVLRVVTFSAPKKNKCFPNRGAQLGKIQFRYEFPEGSNNHFQVTVYYDSASQCYNDNGHIIKCSEILEGAEIGDVRYFEKESKRPNQQVRGILNRLFVVQ